MKHRSSLVVAVVAGAALSCGGGDDGSQPPLAGGAGAAAAGMAAAAGKAGASSGGASGASGAGLGGGAQAGSTQGGSSGKGSAGAPVAGQAGAAGKASGGAGTGGAAGKASGGAGTGGAGGVAGVAGASGASGSSNAGAAGANPTCTASKHYGKAGELWTADGRIVDAGWAGYHTGKDPLPDVAGPVKSVVDFGATPDDDIDDTKAFTDALAATTSGVLLVPAGKFVLTERLTFKTSNVVFRGAGKGKTILYFPKSLGDVYGLSFDAAGHSNWSFGGGFLTVQGSNGGAKLADVTANAARGATTLKVASTVGLTAGQWVRIVQKDAGGSLLTALHEGAFPGNAAEDGGKEVFHFYSPVASVGAGAVTLERPLPFEIDTAWSPTVSAVKSTVTEVGIEHLSMKFLGTPYPGHFKEHGYNAIQLSNVMHCWVRDVEILNADYGVSVGGSFFSTVTDVTLDTDFDRGALVGHHGLNSSGGNDVWFTRFDVKKTFVHDLTVDGYAFGTVWSGGKGVNLNMDHHGRAPYGTLWTALDFGSGTRAFDSGGSANRMPHSGARSTYWNLVGAKALGSPPADFGPLLTFVAMKGQTTAGASKDWSIETIDGTSLCQPDLHEAMLARRP